MIAVSYARKSTDQVSVRPSEHSAVKSHQHPSHATGVSLSLLDPVTEFVELGGRGGDPDQVQTEYQVFVQASRAAQVTR